MRRLSLLAALAAVLAVAPGAHAQVARYTPQGCGTLSVTTGAAVLLSSGTYGGVSGIPANATFALIVPTANPVNYRDDGTAPTSTAGTSPQWSPGGLYPYQGTPLSALQMIGVGGTSVVGICFYR